MVKGQEGIALTDALQQKKGHLRSRQQIGENNRSFGHHTRKTEDIPDNTQGRQKTFRGPHKEDTRHSGHYIRMTEDIRTPHKEVRRHSRHYIVKTENISDTTQGRQKTFRTPHKEDRRHFGHHTRKTEHISDTTWGRIIANIPPDHSKASTRRPATAEHISHSAA